MQAASSSGAACILPVDPSQATFPPSGKAWPYLYLRFACRDIVQAIELERLLVGVLTVAANNAVETACFCALQIHPVFHPTPGNFPFYFPV